MDNKRELKEVRAHGDIMLPLTVYQVIPEQNIEHKLHWHEEIEIAFIPSGTSVFHVGSKQVIVGGDQALFINKRELHSGNNDCFHYVVVFDPKMLSSATNDACQTKVIIPLLKNQYKLPRLIQGKAPWEKEIIAQICEIIKLYEEKPLYYEFAIKSSLFRIFWLIISNKHFRKRPPLKLKNIDRMMEVLNYIHENFDKKISILELARMLNMNQGHFSRFFRNQTGKTPTEYINQCRIGQAAVLLKDPERKILDISLEVGFENLSYFIRTFKTFKSFTPSEYREKVLELK